MSGNNASSTHSKNGVSPILSPKHPHVQCYGAGSGPLWEGSGAGDRRYGGHFGRTKWGGFGRTEPDSFGKAPIVAPLQPQSPLWPHRSTRTVTRVTVQGTVHILLPCLPAACMLQPAQQHATTNKSCKARLWPAATDSGLAKWINSRLCNANCGSSHTGSHSALGLLRSEGAFKPATLGRGSRCCAPFPCCATSIGISYLAASLRH
jgi:hypothetical protein